MTFSGTRAKAAVGVLFTLVGCGGERPDILGASDGKLAACPDSPNCVSSDAGDDAKRVQPFQFDGDQAAVWTALRAAVEAEPRTTVISDDGTYLHAEAKSRIFGFIDDLEFLLKPEERMIAIRSAARTGHSDFGVNAERVEAIRGRLMSEGHLR